MHVFMYWYKYIYIWSFFLKKWYNMIYLTNVFSKLSFSSTPALLAVGEASSLWRRMRRSKWGFGAGGRFVSASDNFSSIECQGIYVKTLLSTDWKCLQSSKRTTTHQQSISLDPSQNNPVVLCLKIRDFVGSTQAIWPGEEATYATL